MCGCECVHTCTCAHIHAHRHAFKHAITHVWRSEDTLQEWALSFIMWVLRIKFSGQAWTAASLPTGPTLQPSNLIMFYIKLTLTDLYILIKNLNKISWWMSFLKLCAWRVLSHSSITFPFFTLGFQLLPWWNLWNVEWVAWHTGAALLIIWSLYTWGHARACA